MRYVRLFVVVAVAAGLLAACGDDPALTTDVYEYPGDADADGGDVIADDVERVVVDPHDFTLEYHFEVDPRDADTECRVRTDDEDGSWEDCDSPFVLDEEFDAPRVQEGYLFFDVRAYEQDGDDRIEGAASEIETLVLFDFDFWFDDLDEYLADATDPDFGFPDEYEAICTRDGDYDGDYTPHGYVPDDCEMECSWEADGLDDSPEADCSFDEPFDIEFPDGDLDRAYLEVEACATNFGGERDDEHCLEPRSYLFYPAPAQWQQLSSGERHTCGIIEDDSLWCWGRNAAGQVGDGTNEDIDTATEIGTDHGDWQTVSAGGSHTCAIDDDNALYCWGENTDDQLGRGDFGAADQPRLSDDTFQWEQVDAGGSHTCAITTDSELYCWGANFRGQLGTGADSGSHAEPGLVSDDQWLDVSAGEEHTCGIRIRQDTNVAYGYCWGNAADGRLANSQNSGQFDTPQEIDDSSSLEFQSGTLSAGAEHTCAVISDDAHCWGNGSQGRLGYDEDDTSERLIPEDIDEGDGYGSLAAGTDHSCGVGPDGVARCWGRNHAGQIGDGGELDQANIPHPVDVPDGETFTDVSAGEEFSCGITDEGVMLCWGSGEHGRLGNGSTDSQSSAAEIAWPQGRLVPQPTEDGEAANGEGGGSDD